jgi:hypothetical protein
MTVRKIKITLRKDGTQSIEVLGATGDSCVELTSALEKRLGAQQGERELKPEYHETEALREPEREKER